MLRITVDYDFVYVIEPPGKPAQWTRIVQQRYGWVDFARWDDPGAQLEPWFDMGCGAAGGLCGERDGHIAPAIQIGALSGVTRSMTGLASGLVETMREIAGAIGVAAVSTVLVSRACAAGPSARALGTPNVLHAAYWVIVAVAALGAPTAAMAFPWRATRKTGPVRYRAATSRR